MITLRKWPEEGEARCPPSPWRERGWG